MFKKVIVVIIALIAYYMFWAGFVLIIYGTVILMRMLESVL